jgi:hypothetical protein
LTTATLEQAVNANSWPVALLEKSQVGIGEAILTIMIADVISFFNIGKNMTAQQIKSTVELLLTDIESKNLKPEDYKVIFRNAKSGLYGQIYDRVDGQVIFGWVRAYAAERMAFCEQNSINKHQQEKKEPQNPIHPQILQSLKEAKELAESNEIKPEKKARVIERSPRDIFIQDTFREFDKLHRKSGIQLRGVNFIEYEGKKVDQVEFTQIKLTEYDNNHE